MLTVFLVDVYCEHQGKKARWIFGMMGPVRRCFHSGIIWENNFFGIEVTDSYFVSRWRGNSEAICYLKKAVEKGMLADFVEHWGPSHEVWRRRNPPPILYLTQNPERAF